MITNSYKEVLFFTKYVHNLNCRRFPLHKFVTVCMGGKLENRDREVKEATSDHKNIITQIIMTYFIATES